MASADDPDMIAAALALGLLEGEERAAALRRVLADPAFAREVEHWRMRFGTMFAEWPEAEPPAELEKRILNRIGDQGGTRPVRWWRSIAALATLTAAGLAAMLLLRPEPSPSPAPVAQPATPAPAPLVAVLTGTGSPVAALFDRASGELRLSGPVPTPSGRQAELWAIRDQEPPRSLGLLPSAQSTRLALRPEARRYVARGVTLAVSIEPPGGSPNAGPTGPVIAAGALAPT